MADSIGVSELTVLSSPFLVPAFGLLVVSSGVLFRLVEVPGSGIHVLVADASSRRIVISIAEISAFALFNVSSYSADGSESATTPQPAWTCTTPSFTTMVRRAMQVSMLPR